MSGSVYLIDPANPGVGALGTPTDPMTIMQAGLSIPTYDYILLGYTGSNLTSVAYYVGGAGGTLVASLALTYDGSSNLLTVTRSPLL